MDPSPGRHSKAMLLLSFERKVLHTILGAKQGDRRWRRRYNFELEREYGEAKIVAAIKVNRLR